MISADGKPDWMEPAKSRLERYEQKELAAGTKAYVFVTNMAFHRDLYSKPSVAAWPFGLGMLDFNRPGMIQLSEAYRQKQKHMDAYSIGQSIEHYLHFPATFDGKLPTESFGMPSSRVVIGKTYSFGGVGEKGINGTVTAATVDELNKLAIIGITDGEGRSHILRLPMTEDDFSEYTEFPNAYFGRVLPGPTKLKNNFELFERLMATHTTTPRANMLAWFSKTRDMAALEELSDEDLRVTYCEAMVAATEALSTKPTRPSPTPPMTTAPSPPK